MYAFRLPESPHAYIWNKKSISSIVMVYGEGEWKETRRNFLLFNIILYKRRVLIYIVIYF